jgi:hypothetical protein
MAVATEFEVVPNVLSKPASSPDDVPRGHRYYHRCYYPTRSVRPSPVVVEHLLTYPSCRRRLRNSSQSDFESLARSFRDLRIYVRHRINVNGRWVTYVLHNNVPGERLMVHQI